MTRPEGSRNHNYEGMPELKGSKIAKVRKDKKDVIQEFMLETGEIIGYDEAIDLVESGQSSGLISQWGRDRKILRSHPDGSDSNDLDNLEEY